jgi:hypothetical protein
MTLRKILPLIFVLIFNLWLVRIFRFNVFIGIAAIIGSVFIYLSIQRGTNKYLYFSGFCIFVLMFFQYKTSSVNSLVFLNENEKIEQQQRMRGYPKSLYRFANWLEQRKEALIFYKIEENFSEIADPNLYFLANHPRERIGIVEYEKMPYIFLPFFIIGILSINKTGVNILLLSISPVILLSLIGNSNPIGPFSLFPLLVAYIAKGLEPVFKNKKYFIAFILIFCLVFIQTVSYATF